MEWDDNVLDEFVDVTGESVGEFLGDGSYGWVYQLTDNRVVKFIGKDSRCERDFCVWWLRHRPDTKVWPRIDSIHYLPQNYCWAIIREDIPDTDPDMSGELEDELIRDAKEVFLKYAWDFDDAFESNFGQRPGDPYVLVLRDLGCCERYSRGEAVDRNLRRATDEELRGKINGPVLAFE